MNRQIKFRAWDKGNERMIYPLPISNNTSGDILNRWDDENIMQFTGIFDKNGKEIYEGDIVKYEDSKLYVVEWNNNFAGLWLLSNIKYDNGPHGMGFEETDSRENEVIGNIYENKELI